MPTNPYYVRRKCRSGSVAESERNQLTLWTSLFGPKKSNQFQKFLGEKNSELSEHPGVWLLGDNYNDLLIGYFENLSPELQEKDFSRLLAALAQVPPEIALFQKTLKTAGIPFSERGGNAQSAYPHWIYKTEFPSDILSNISDINSWLTSWDSVKRIEKIVNWVSRLYHIEQEVRLFLQRELPGSRPLYHNLQRSLDVTRNLLFHIKTLPPYPHRKRVWLNFGRSFAELNRDYKNLKEEQSRWNGLYQNIQSLFEDETELDNLSFVAFSANRLQSFLHKPARTVYSIADLELAMNDVRKALEKNREQIDANKPTAGEDHFPGGEFVWGNLATDPMPNDRYACLQEMVVRSDILVGRLFERYCRKVIRVRISNESDAHFVSMLINPENNLRDIKAWLKQAQPKPRGAKKFKQFLSGNFEAIHKLSEIYSDNEDRLFGSAIRTTSWWRGGTARLPQHLPKWIDDLLKEWLADVPENLPRILSNDWDRNVFALLSRISGTRPYIMQYLENVWKTLGFDERKWLWHTCPDKFKQKWLKQWASKWFGNELSVEEIEIGLAVYLIKEKLTLLKRSLEMDPLPQIEAIRTIFDKVGKAAENELQTYLKQYYDGEISPSKGAVLINLASEFLGNSLELVDPSPAFLQAVLRSWKPDSADIGFGPQIIAEACWKMARKGIIKPELDLLFYANVPIEKTGTLELSKPQWKILEPAFDNPENLDFERVITFMKWRVPTFIPLKVWRYFIEVIREKGEQHLLDISVRCQEVLEIAKKNKKEEISRLANRLYWAYTFFSNRCSASDVPDRVLEIEVNE
jgi:hypothetical protein